eukprot:6693088-Prymnesium_polylepis.1
MRSSRRGSLRARRWWAARPAGLTGCRGRHLWDVRRSNDSVWIQSLTLWLSLYGTHSNDGNANFVLSHPVL